MGWWLQNESREAFFQREGYWQGCPAKRMHCEQNYLSQDNSLQGQTLTLHWWGKRGSQEAIEEELFEGGIGPDQLPLEDCKQLSLLSKRISYQHRIVRTFGAFHPDVPKIRIFPSLVYCTLFSRPQESLHFSVIKRSVPLLTHTKHKPARAI